MAQMSNYTTVKKEEVRRISRTGEPVTYYRIFATSKGGTSFHVEVAEDQLAKAPDMLSKRAAELDGI